MKSRCLIVLLIYCLHGCGGGAEAVLTSGSASNAVQLVLSKQIQTRVQDRIVQVRVRISADDMSEQEYLFDAGQGDVRLDDLPLGVNRLIAVDGFDADDVRIRTGSTYVDIVGGDAIDVPIALEAVPHFANLRDGHAILAHRLRPEIRGVVDADVTLLYRAEGSSHFETLSSIDCGAPPWRLNALGTRRCDATSLPAGAYEFALQDAEGAQHHRISLQLKSASRVGAAAMYSAFTADTHCQRVSTVTGMTAAPWCAAEEQ